MKFARKVWRLLVAIKDGLSLLFLLLFFGAIYALLAGRPGPAQVREGALLLRLKGAVVEEPAEADPIALLMSGGAGPAQMRERDLVRAIDTAAGDRRIKAVVLDLSGFTGAGRVHLAELGAALDRVKAAKKPVLTYATAYDDDSLLLAAHASEAWINPLGAAYVLGPGGNSPYYGDLLAKWKVQVHVYRVGTYKEFVEPYVRDAMSEPAREARKAVLGALFGEWKANVAKARPKANLALVTSDPGAWLKASGGDTAKAAVAAGLVDRIGDRVEFGERVAALVGEDKLDPKAGSFVHTPLKAWLAANPAPGGGKGIAVLTIAGDIVDGDAGPGMAGGDRIAALLDGAEAKNIAGLVVRVDSPGGSVLASEQIRRAIERVKARGIPVAVSMANLAASGGYWVSTPGARIFAEPETVTGSIGIFAVLPSFEKTLADYGVKSDGVGTTPMSGQPDIIGGFTPEVDSVFQQGIEAGYARFIGLVAKSRGKTPADIDRIAQGRIWDGGTARQIGLVDQFGGLDDALGWVAGQAKLDEGDWHPVYLGAGQGGLAAMLGKVIGGDDDSEAPESDAVARIAQRRQQALGAALASVQRLMGAEGAQARCLGCPDVPAARGAQPARGWLALLVRIFG
ncbi:signal peptide peptidase SppA [Novosphingobium flavum]|uniref:Signal peptide peptidase SppA n=1 Tax=Novosphingobium flavum TaxID=1778672 RepID=A0A7X1FUU0_9SPHN|nr:signal peptide peptidase SppA [Novosphingobium flavum]MBC2667254.1 signal peptide peptidase SppA [Novosphingobium flavum]